MSYLEERKLTASVELRVYDGVELKEYALTAPDDTDPRADAQLLLQQIILNRLRDMGVKDVIHVSDLDSYMLTFHQDNDFKTVRLPVTE